MLKFILFLVVLFLAMRLAVRLVFSFLRGGTSSVPRSSREIDEADYEVIESHLKDKEHL